MARIDENTTVASALPDRGGPRLRHPTLLAFIVIMFVVAVTVYAVMVTAQRRLIEHEAVKIAEIVSRNALAARTVFSSEVVDKLSRDGFGASAESKEQIGHVMLPAQFLKLIGRESSLTADGTFKFHPLSKWNLEPAQGLNDDFQRWAWAELEKQDRAAPDRMLDWQPAMRFENIDGARTLRYLRADPASKMGCVGCHNAYELRPEIQARRVAQGLMPGKQWMLHQLLGAIEVQVPVDRVEALAEGQTRLTVAVVLSITFAGLFVVGIFAYRDLAIKQVLVERFERQAKYDALTGLPNRLLLRERTELLIQHAARHRERAGVLFIDLDDFKNINDSLGHAAGDAVLRETAVRLARLVREVDTVARYSGDEFVVLVSNVRQPDDLGTVGRKLVDAIAQPHRIAGHELFITASIGISCFPTDSHDAETLLKNADAAMYRAKEVGRNNVQYFSADMNAKALYKLGMLAKLRQAIERSELTLYYQPKYTAAGALAGAEALIRWNHPEFGLLQPEAFVSLAEESGLIEAIGDWALDHAIGQWRQWEVAGCRPGTLALNVSARQFRPETFAQQVLNTLDKLGLPATQLEIEITESMVVRDPDAALAALSLLHGAGVSIAIDDFGIGHSALSYLKRFPISTLKVDKSFVDGIPGDTNDCALTRGIVAMAKGLELRVVAEGVETEDQHRFLIDAGCDEMQGYLFGRPMPATEFAKLLRARSDTAQ